MTRSKHSSTPLIFSACLAIKAFTALLLPGGMVNRSPVGPVRWSQGGQRRSIQIFGCGEAAVGVSGGPARPLLCQQLVRLVMGVRGAGARVDLHYSVARRVVAVGHVEGRQPRP